MTENVFLIARIDSEISTEDTFAFGRGVNKVSSEDSANPVVRTFKSVTSKVEEGKNPLEIPETVATPSISTVVVPTLTTLAIIGSPVNPAVVSVY